MKENSIDFRNLPKEYVTEMFCDLAYDVTHYTGNNSYNGGCPICHEGSSFGKKKRCWWLPDKGFIHCFNCGETWNPINFIKAASGMDASEIARQIKSGDYGFINLDREESYCELPQEVLNLFDTKNGTLPDDSIDLTNDSQLSYYKGNSAVQKALRYIKKRRLSSAVNRPDKFYISLNDYTHRNRLVFPFCDRNGKVVFYQTRAIGANVDGYREDIRYLGKAGSEKSVFNVDKIKDDIPEIFVFEGPIDSCFMKNGVAIAGISKGGNDLTRLQEEQLSLLCMGHELVWMLDNQWIDETARQKSESLLRKGERVFIWPEEWKEYKDFNDICVQNGLDSVPVSLVRKYVYSGEKGLLRLLECNLRATEETNVESIIDSLNI